MIQSGSKILASLLLTICVVTSGSAQSASPERLVDDFVTAWNSHDEKAFDRLFTDDVIWVESSEKRQEGRSEVMGGFARIHSATGWAKNSTVTPSAIKVRTLGPDAAVVLYHANLAGRPDKDGKHMPDVDRAMMIVAVKGSDGWRITAGQITKPASKAAP